ALPSEDVWAPRRTLGRVVLHDRSPDPLATLDEPRSGPFVLPRRVLDVSSPRPRPEPAPRAPTLSTTVLGGTPPHEPHRHPARAARRPRRRGRGRARARPRRGGRGRPGRRPPAADRGDGGRARDGSGRRAGAGR